jgi:hypothetical protein
MYRLSQPTNVTLDGRPHEQDEPPLITDILLPSPEDPLPLNTLSIEALIEP